MDGASPAKLRPCVIALSTSASQVAVSSSEMYPAKVALPESTIGAAYTQKTASAAAAAHTSGRRPSRNDRPTPATASATTSGDVNPAVVGAHRRERRGDDHDGEAGRQHQRAGKPPPRDMLEQKPAAERQARKAEAETRPRRQRAASRAAQTPGLARFRRTGLTRCAATIARACRAGRVEHLDLLRHPRKGDIDVGRTGALVEGDGSVPERDGDRARLLRRSRRHRQPVRERVCPDGQIRLGRSRANAGRQIADIDAAVRRTGQLDPRAGDRPQPEDRTSRASPTASVNAAGVVRTGFVTTADTFDDEALTGRILPAATSLCRAAAAGSKISIWAAEPGNATYTFVGREAL